MFYHSLADGQLGSLCLAKQIGLLPHYMNEVLFPMTASKL